MNLNEFDLRILDRMDDNKYLHVQVVRGKPYSFELPPRTPIYFVLASIFVAVTTGNGVHFSGTLAVLLIGLWGANPRMRPLGAGCLPFLFFLAGVVLAVWRLGVGLPIVLWGTIAWLVASIELRLKMKPYILENEHLQPGS